MCIRDRGKPFLCPPTHRQRHPAMTIPPSLHPLVENVRELPFHREHVGYRWRRERLIQPGLVEHPREIEVESLALHPPRAFHQLRRHRAEGEPGRQRERLLHTGKTEVDPPVSYTHLRAHETP